jgi:hypothetical protein
MVRNSTIHFKKRYGAALRLHLATVMSWRKNEPFREFGVEKETSCYGCPGVVRMLDHAMNPMPTGEKT